MDKMTKACIQKTEFDDWLIKSTVFKEKSDKLESIIESNNNKDNSFFDKLKQVSDQLLTVNQCIDSHNIKMKNDLKSVVNLEQFYELEEKIVNTIREKLTLSHRELNKKVDHHYLNKIFKQKGLIDSAHNNIST